MATASIASTNTDVGLCGDQITEGGTRSTIAQSTLNYATTTVL